MGFVVFAMDTAKFCRMDIKILQNFKIINNKIKNKRKNRKQFKKATSYFYIFFKKRSLPYCPRFDFCGVSTFFS